MEESTKKESCKGNVMSRIKCERICPRSRMFFQTRECFVWSLWFISVIVGALAVAVTLFVITCHQNRVYETTDGNVFLFILEALPLLWILLLGLMIGIGTFNLRQTKQGYRYPLWKIVLSSVALSLVGGVILQLLGFGYTVDKMLGQKMPMYTSQDKVELKPLQSPEKK